MGVYSPGAEPVINGWFTSVTSNGRLRADRVDPLTRYQVEAGCRAVVEADTPEELDWLCTAWRGHAEVVRRAEEASETAAAGSRGGNPAAVRGQ